jgi:hypothetical protein
MCGSLLTILKEYTEFIFFFNSVYNLEKLEVAFGSIMERRKRRASSRHGASETSAEGREGRTRRFLQRMERGRGEASEISTEVGGGASEISAGDGEKRPRSFCGGRTGSASDISAEDGQEGPQRFLRRMEREGLRDFCGGWRTGRA